MDENKKQCIEAGMNDFVTKPIHPEFLFARVAAWLEQRSTPAKLL
jgi:DNA-binding response OmpR family regulator